MVKVEITNKKIEHFKGSKSHKNIGTELIFNGRVRNLENGKKIVALEYEEYKQMAKSELLNLAKRTITKFKISDLFCTHRVGKIKVGEISIQVIIWSKHRQAGINGLAWFISELKKSVPIWKWGIFKGGKKIPKTKNI